MGFVHSLVQTVTMNQIVYGLLKYVVCGQSDEKEQLVMITTREVISV